MDKLLGYVMGGIVIAVVGWFSIKEVVKSIKAGGCNCSNCPSAKNKR
ncbi:putative membrane protein [Gottschalkia acidurici 9a]|uniref:Membrane protein n=1 Tax=Gottschalkia acidurici (strain ATCC 7906 / DSM 604 / BCRC 14475 / CIP 104303 / KCTC 5404 / NCIMB 10678 / 9a) TaxID=1128398 RepID=K0B092_GOTA9|nr:FeoB-associated Cys-rich membrane protein [Gottschalkia acidurici]AFS79453.1 putative membrane protein [Gottschalkia acidurici 9a]